jgi:hypothetical protein
MKTVTRSHSNSIIKMKHASYVRVDAINVMAMCALPVWKAIRELEPNVSNRAF